MELLFRSGYKYPHTHKSMDRSDTFGLWVPITHMWMEGPDDMHVHLGGVENSGHIPYYSHRTGDYIAPDPDSPGFVRVYSIMILPAGKRASRLLKADDAYIDRLRYIWMSHNVPADNRIAARLAAFDRKMTTQRHG